MFRDTYTSLRGKREGEDLPCGDVADIVGLWKLRYCKPSIGKGNDGLRPCATKRRSLIEKVPQVFGCLTFTVDGIGGIQQGTELQDRGDFSMAIGEERALAILAKAQGSDS